MSLLSQSKRFLPYVACAIVLGFFGLHIYERLVPKKLPPMLTQVEGMVELRHIEDIQAHSQTPITLPTQTFGGTLTSIAVYPKASSAFPADSIALVFTRDHTRVVELNILPSTSAEQQMMLYDHFPHERVVIGESSDANLFRLRSRARCMEPKQQDAISFCQFTRVLIFDHNNTLIKLFADSDHLTDGELIEMARSIK